MFVIKTLFSGLQTVEMPLTAEPDPFWMATKSWITLMVLEEQKLLIWRGILRRLPDAEPPPCRNSFNLCLRAECTCQMKGISVWERRIPPFWTHRSLIILGVPLFLSDSHHDLFYWKFSIPIWWGKKGKKEKKKVKLIPDWISCPAQFAGAVVRILWCVWGYSRVCAWNRNAFPPWIQLFGLFNIPVYIADGRQSLGDKRGNISGNVTAAWKVYAAAVRPHNVQTEERKKKRQVTIVWYCFFHTKTILTLMQHRTCRHDFLFAAPMHIGIFMVLWILLGKNARLFSIQTALQCLYVAKMMSWSKCDGVWEFIYFSKLNNYCLALNDAFSGRPSAVESNTRLNPHVSLWFFCLYHIFSHCLPLLLSAVHCFLIIVLYL